VYVTGVSCADGASAPKRGDAAAKPGEARRGGGEARRRRGAARRQRSPGERDRGGTVALAKRIAGHRSAAKRIATAPKSSEAC